MSFNLLRETENPKVVGKSRKSRLRRVDLPAPDGPEKTKNDLGNVPLTTTSKLISVQNF